MLHSNSLSLEVSITPCMRLYIYIYTCIYYACESLYMIFPLHTLVQCILMSHFIFASVLSLEQRNQTDIEAWILEKAEASLPANSKFVYPYNLGVRKNIVEAWTHWRCRDGINWSVRDGTQEF